MLKSMLMFLFIIVLSGPALSLAADLSCRSECLKLLREHTLQSISLLQGKPRIFPASAFGSPDPQRILLLENLKKSQRNLVVKLANLSIDPKVINVNKANVESGVEQVEMGAFLVMLKDGRAFYDIHTSHETTGVKEQAISTSLERVFKSNGIKMTDVALLEYYHTHPWGSGTEQPLSGFDANFIKTWLVPKVIEATGGPKFPINLYAISQTDDGHLYLYQSSY